MGEGKRENADVRDAGLKGGWGGMLRSGLGIYRIATAWKLHAIVLGYL